jgi:hypothetical protein
MRLERAVASLGEGSGRRRRRPGWSGKAVSAPSSTRSKPEPRVGGEPKVGKRAARGRRRDGYSPRSLPIPAPVRPSEPAESIGIRPTQVHALIAKARAEKLIVKRGNGYALKAQ